MNIEQHSPHPFYADEQPRLESAHLLIADRHSPSPLSPLNKVSSLPVLPQHLVAADLAEHSVIPPRITEVAGQTRQRPGLAKSTGADDLTGLPQAAMVLIEPSTSAMLGSSRAVGLAYPGRILRYVPGKALSYDSAAKQWQERMQQRGWSIQADGFYGAESEKICRQFQQEKGIQVDGRVGPATWTAAFRADNLSASSFRGSINPRGLDLVKRSEGLVLSAYRDPVGIWTIGYGHTGPEVKPGLKISATQAETLLRKDLSRFEAAVRGLVKVPVNTNQFSALVSFTYNVGAGALAQSTLLALLNQQNYQGAADQFSRWVYGGGQALPGLVKRRTAERALFLTPV